MLDVVLHGRELPLGQLRGALEGALGGRGQLAVLTGEAGIGKTALATAIARDAEARGATVTWGRAWEFADAPPHFPLWPCLRELGLAIGDERRSDADSYHFWEEVVGALARASSSKPAVWILEDLHAADLGTLDLLTFLAQPARALPVLVVATARASDPRLSDRMVQRLTRMARDGLDIRLEPLAGDDVAALVASSLGRPAPVAAIARLVELTGGNPLFVVECARAFKAAGGIEGTLTVLPSTVRQVVLERVALLSEATRSALQCGAVLGREFSAAAVARMTGQLPARVIDTLLPALRAGIVTELRPAHFLFSHTLVRDAIEDALGAEERAALHGHAEDALTPLGDAPEILLERARHALIALRAGDESRVLAVAERALALLEREGAFDRALELHLRIEEARSTGILPPGDATRKLHLARIARAAGRSEVARALCDELVIAARRSGDAALLADAALLYGADLRPGVIDRALVGRLEEALAALGDTSRELRCRVLGRLAAALQPALDPNGPMVTAREAIASARATGDDAVLLDVLEVAGSALVDFAPVAERFALDAELLERALSANDLPKAMRARTRLAFDHLETGDLAAFERDIDRILELSVELGHPRFRWRALLLASARAVSRGAFADSDRYVVEVSRLGGLTDDPALPLTLAAHDVMRLRLQRRDEELRAALDGLVPLMKGIPLARAALAAVRATAHARMEDVEATRRELAIVGPAPHVLELDFGIQGWLAEAHALAGTEETRRRLRDQLGRSTARELTGSHVTFTHEGSVVRMLGLLDASLGEHASAERHLREAHAVAVERGHRPWVAQITYELSKVLRGAGQEEEAATLFAESMDLARELGMTGLSRLATGSGAGSSAPAGAPITTAMPSTDIRMARDGEGWTIERGGRAVRLRDTRGMQLLSRLVQRPGEEVHVLALASDEAGSIVETSAGELLDDRARAQYRDRVAGLDEDIAEASSHGDLGRLEKLRGEREALLEELGRAVGLGGRVRQAGSATERARVNVQRRVKDAIARISTADAELGRFFEQSVKTGTFCCFRP